MNYRKIYMKIISNAKKEEKLGIRVRGNGNYYEAHHILPKSLFPLWIKRKSNIVLLTAREHFFCHQLLTKIYPCDKMNYALYAFISRPNSDYKISSKEYERIKETHSKMMSLKFKGKSPKNKGLKMSDEQRQKLSKALSGRKLSEEHRKKIGEASKNRKLSDEAKLKISIGNKGKKMSDEAKLKISLKQSGKKVSESTKKKLSEINKGKTLSDEHKAKISLAHKGKVFSDEHKKALSLHHHLKGKTLVYYIQDEQSNILNQFDLGKKLNLNPGYLVELIKKKGIVYNKRYTIIEKKYEKL